ncbi:hypothetical protein LXL04_038339 [Taraxacum kok-saghyz]
MFSGVVFHALRRTGPPPATLNMVAGGGGRRRSLRRSVRRTTALLLLSRDDQTDVGFLTTYCDRCLHTITINLTNDCNEDMEDKVVELEASQKIFPEVIGLALANHSLQPNSNIFPAVLIPAITSPSYPDCHCTLPILDLSDHHLHSDPEPPDISPEQCDRSTPTNKCERHQLPAATRRCCYPLTHSTKTFRRSRDKALQACVPSELRHVTEFASRVPRNSPTHQRIRHTRWIGWRSPPQT